MVHPSPDSVELLVWNGAVSPRGLTIQVGDMELWFWENAEPEKNVWLVQIRYQMIKCGSVSAIRHALVQLNNTSKGVYRTPSKCQMDQPSAGCLGFQANE